MINITFKTKTKTISNWVYSEVFVNQSSTPIKGIRPIKDKTLHLCKKRNLINNTTFCYQKNNKRSSENRTYWVVWNFALDNKSTSMSLMSNACIHFLIRIRICLVGSSQDQSVSNSTTELFTCSDLIEWYV